MRKRFRKQKEKILYQKYLLVRQKGETEVPDKKKETALTKTQTETDLSEEHYLNNDTFACPTNPDIETETVPEKANHVFQSVETVRLLQNSDTSPDETIINNPGKVSQVFLVIVKAVCLTVATALISVLVISLILFLFGRIGILDTSTFLKIQEFIRNTKLL